MCQSNTCPCRISVEDVADEFVDIFESVFTVQEEAQLHKELGLGTDPQW